MIRRRTAMLGWLAAMLLAVAAPAEAQTWSEYRSEPGRYRVEMPGKPEIEKAPIKIQTGTTDLIQAIVEVGETTFLASHVDYPESVLHGLSPQQVLINTRNGSAAGFKLLSDRALSVSGYPAREYVIQRDKGIVLVTRTAFAGQRLYQLVVASLGGGPDDPQTRRFLDSFNVISP